MLFIRVTSPKLEILFSEMYDLLLSLIIKNIGWCAYEKDKKQ